MASQSFLARPVRYRYYNATLWLVVANVAVFLLTYVLPRVHVYLDLIPVLVVRRGWVWQLATYMFVHDPANLTHIVLNMIVLFLFGTQLERKWGSTEFLIYYFVTGMGAGMATVAMNMWVLPNLWNVPVMGASGAIFGLMLAYASLFPNSVILVFGIIPLRARVAVLLYAVLEVVFQLLRIQTGVAHLTHLSGFLFGYLYFRVRLGMDPLPLLLGRRQR